MASLEEGMLLERTEGQDLHQGRAGSVKIDELLLALEPLGIVEPLPAGQAEGALAELRDIEDGLEEIGLWNKGAYAGE